MEFVLSLIASVLIGILVELTLIRRNIREFIEDMYEEFEWEEFNE